MAPAVVAVCGRDRGPALASLAERLPLSGLVCPGRSPDTAAALGKGVAVHRSLAAALDAGALAVAVLSPYRGLDRDLALCRERGVAAVCAGPPPGGDGAAASQVAPGRWLYAPALRKVDELRGRPAFGQPVYLRRVAGGGTGLLAAWWSALECLEAAAALLGSPPARLWTSATRWGSRWQVTATVVAESRATAHLVVMPTPAPGDEVMMLGTGGTIATQAAQTGATCWTDGGQRVLPVPSPWPDGDWAAAALAGEPRAWRSRVGPELPQRLLAALRLAARKGRLVSVAEG